MFRPIATRGALAAAAALVLACQGSSGGSADGPRTPPAADCTPSDWPTAENTGIPAGTPSLTVLSDASLHTTQDGQIFDAVELPLRIEAKEMVVVRHNRWRRGHLGNPVHTIDTVMTAWEDNSYEDGEVIPAP